MKILITILFFIFSFTIHASDLDVLIARTALALGDEYSKLATNYQVKMADFLEVNPAIDSEAEEDVPEEYKFLKSKYHSYRQLALDEYGIVFCNNLCSLPVKPTGLELPVRFNFLRREAFSKYERLKIGSNSNGTVSKLSTIYAVNSNFEEHILSKIIRLIEVQQRLDAEARKLSSTLNDLQNSYVSTEAEIIGVEREILNEQNYVADTQGQLASYQSCISSASAEDSFEKDELIKSIKQLETLQKNVGSHFEKAYDYVYQNSAGQKVSTVQANQKWQIQDLTFTSGDRVLITATGAWNFKGAVSIFEPSHLDVNDSEDKFFFKKIAKAISKIVNPVISAVVSAVDGIIKPTPEVLKALAQSHKPAFDRILQGLDSRPEGYTFSFSEGLSNGISSGSSSSLSLYFGVSSSAGSSTGQSVGTGGTYALKLTTLAKPQFPLGALIGSFCEVAPLPTSGCEIFLIGGGTLVEVPTNLGAKKLWLMGNDGGSYTNNKGSVQVTLQKQTTFKSYWDQYYDWFDDECDENGYDCGLGIVLENIAYTPNPYTAVKAIFTRQFPEFPEEVSNLILQQVNYMVEQNLAQKDIKAKELSRELHATKIASCRDQLELSKDKLRRTKELMSTYQRRAQTIKTKEVILDTSTKFYEQELAAINTIRTKNLERIKRYYALTVSSYNYLYLDDLKIEGEAQPYFEGDFYKNQIDLIEDLILEITTVNDLLNPNRGFMIYELSKEELQGITHPDYRLRKSHVKLDYNDFFCQGFNIENQARLMIDKVGVLLDIDPAKEHLFFKNSNKRSTQVQLSHGLENRFFNFDGSEKEFWMPSQKRNVAGHSTRILADSNSDYFQLRDARFFERLSFRKTSVASSWSLDMTDPAIMMYENSDTTFSNPLLKGMKLIFWFNSAELQGESVLNQCLAAPINLSGGPSKLVGTTLSWNFPMGDQDFSKISRFTIYRSSTATHGFKPVGHLSVDECSSDSENVSCTYEDENAPEGTHYYQVRSSYASQSEGTYLDGIPSNAINVEVTKL